MSCYLEREEASPPGPHFALEDGTGALLLEVCPDETPAVEPFAGGRVTVADPFARDRLREDDEEALLMVLLGDRR